MRRTSKSGGDEASRFPQAAGELPASSPARRTGETFVPLWKPARAVVMKLKGQFPRLNVAGARQREETAAPAVDQPPGEEG